MNLKTIVVTGAAQGVGLATATLLAQRNCRVAASWTTARRMPAARPEFAPAGVVQTPRIHSRLIHHLGGLP